MLASLIALALAAAPSATERAQIFRAAGFHLKGGKWRSDQCDGPESPSYSPGKIEMLGDLNRDGRPEALVTETSAMCYGMTGQGYTILTKSPNGRWTKISQNIGHPNFLKTRANGWPELEIGGPGFCFGVHRWTGKSFEYHRSQYDGKPCNPLR